VTDKSKPRFAVRPRTVVIAMLVIVLLVAAGIGAWLLISPSHPGRVRLATLSEDSTSTVGLAGVFPAEDDAPLENPLGIAWDGEQLYVAEADAGEVRIFDSAGGQIGSIVLPLAKGIGAVYPSVLAIADDRLVVVDNAAARVVVVAKDAADPAKVLLTLGSGKTAPIQPTAVTYSEGEYFVADAGDQSVKVYDEDGKHVRTLGETLEPRLGFVGGLALVGDELVVSDSNAGRVVVIDPQTGEQKSLYRDRFTLPRALVAMDKGVVAVVDTFEAAIYLTGPDGVRRDVIDADTVPDWALRSPRGATWIADDARLYVTDAAAGVVCVYNLRLSQP
jgi:DNA-binding beta-propeller fold protein YncE